jgi:hypothetical protein
MSALATSKARRQSIKQHADDPFIVLLTIDSDELPPDVRPIRVARNRKPVVSRGNTYLAYPLAIEEPTDTDQAPECAISIANVSRRIGKAVEALITPPACVIELVLASDPDTVERTWLGLSFVEATWDALQLRAKLQYVEYWDEPWPWVRVTPAGFPGLFP